MPQETLQAKLRNQLSPIYSLSSICVELEKTEFRESLIPLIIDHAKLAEQNREKIDNLLNLIDAERQKYIKEISDLESEKNRVIDLYKEQMEDLSSKVEALEKLLF